jgi:DNA-binding NarL/FixJ family response regulator
LQANPIRIGIVDDHAIVRVGLRELLSKEPDLSVQGEAGCARDAVRLVQSTELDVLLLDLGMPGQSGLDVIGTLKVKAPRLAVLVFTAYDEAHYGKKLLQLGASGFVQKSSEPDTLLAAIRVVSDGKHYISETLATSLAERLVGSEQAVHERLTKREFQVLLKLAAGDKPGAIAKELHLSAKTVTVHRSRLLAKLNLSTNSEITYFAIKQGLIT